MLRTLTPVVFAAILVGMAGTASAGSTAAEAAHDKVRALWGYSDPAARTQVPVGDQVTEATVGAQGQSASIVRDSQEVRTRTNVKAAGAERTGSSGSPASLVQ